MEGVPDPVPSVPLSLSALSLDIVIALDQAVGGLGAGPLGRVIDGPPTSVQNNLRLLVAHGLIQRAATRYVLIADAPGAEELAAAGLRLAPPDAAIRLVLRANPAVEFACEDLGGFVVGLATNATEPALAALDRAIATVRRGRAAAAPPILRFQIDELSRIIHSAIGLRTRVATASVVKGVVRAPGRSTAQPYPIGPGRSPQGS